MSRSNPFLRPALSALPVVMTVATGLVLAAALPASAQTPPAPGAVATLPPAAASAARTPQRAVQPPVLTGAAPSPPMPGANAAPVKSAAGLPAPAASAAPAPGIAAAARWVALDVGHVPGGGSRSASGVAEHNFNLRFAAALEARLRQQGLAVRRLPTNLSLAERAQRAHGAVLVVSVHHDAPPPAPATAGAAARKTPAASTGSGFQLRVGQAEPMACARAVATQLQTAGRHFSTGGTGAWADKAFGVRAGGEGALLRQADVPVLQVSLADIGNPVEERLAGSDAWVARQAGAVAKGLAACLQRPGAKPAPAAHPGAAAARAPAALPAAASAARRA
jgi:N-acetylmuramoyl-L-alanine amidase